MYLNNIQLLKLIVPFVLVGVLYLYSDDLMMDADAVFPTIQEYTNKELDEKANIYLNIQRNKQVYVSILTQMEKRDKEREWISKYLLYLPKKHLLERTKRVQTSVTQRKIIRKKGKWRLQILYPNKKVAIINSRIVHEGSLVDGAEVVEIAQDKVFIKTEQGTKWLSLFH